MVGASGMLTAAVEVAGARLLPCCWAAFGALVVVVLVVGPIGWLGLISRLRSGRSGRASSSCSGAPPGERRAAAAAA